MEEDWLDLERAIGEGSGELKGITMGGRGFGYWGDYEYMIRVLAMPFGADLNQESWGSWPSFSWNVVVVVSGGEKRGSG